jgi:F-type H+-transporting ATPase subunit gamma
MANQRQIKRRISTAKNISQITKAMEMVSASKMKKAQSQALAARPYTRALQSSLQKVVKNQDSTIHPLLTRHYQGKHVLLIISTDKGLVGGLNNHLFKEGLEWLKQHKNSLLIPVGKKAVRFCQLTGGTIHAQFTELPEYLTTSDIAPITTLINDGYLKKEFQTVSILYMDFINTLSQKPMTTQLLPLAQISKDQKSKTDPLQISPSINREYIFEPSAQKILGELLPYYVENTLYQTLLEAKASEHSSRMVAMKNASENAAELMKELKLLYNKTRQANITSELIDLSTASLSIQ